MGALVEAAEAQTKLVIDKETSSITPQIESAKQQESSALERRNQILGLKGPSDKPAKGSAASQ